MTAVKFSIFIVVLSLGTVCNALDKLTKTWKHGHGDSIIQLKHEDHTDFHRKTTLSVDGKVHFEHHTDHFEDGNVDADSAPRLCTPVCDCVMDKDNTCITDRLKKIGLLDQEPKLMNRYSASANEL
eukprot:m.10505 g.10505  ORF g.10505 m.10505 type:complete len:126 (-) comp8348_c0_seq1:84-461(-)